VRRALDQEAVGKAGIGARIRHLQKRIAADRGPAQGVRPRQFPQLQAVPRFEPLPVVVHERDQGDRRREQLRRHFGDAVETGFGRGIQDGAPAQRAQARILPAIMLGGHMTTGRQRPFRRCDGHLLPLFCNCNVKIISMS
jgi:hypothetical protein